MELSRRTLLIMVGSFLALLCAFALAVGLLVWRNSVRNHLAAAGFAGALDVQIRVGDGVTVRGLTRSRPLKIGNAEAQLDIDAIRVPLDIETIIADGAPSISQVEVRGLRLALTMIPPEVKPKRSKTRLESSSVPALLKALPRLCTRGCNVNMSDVHVTLGVPGLEFKQLGVLSGTAKLNPKGHLDAQFRSDDGRSFVLAFDISKPVKTLEAHILRPGKLVVYPEELRKIVPAIPDTGFEKLELSAQGMHIRPGGNIHLVDTQARVFGRGEKLFDAKAGLIAAGKSGLPWCKEQKFCPSRFEDISLNLDRSPIGKGLLSKFELTAKRLEECGKNCVSAAGIDANIHTRMGSIGGGIGQLALHWKPEAPVPHKIEIRDGRIEVAPRAIPEINLWSEAEGQKSPTQSAQANENEISEKLSRILHRFDRHLDTASRSIHKYGKTWMQMTQDKPEIIIQTTRLELNLPGSEPFATRIFDFRWQPSPKGSSTISGATEFTWNPMNGQTAAAENDSSPNLPNRFQNTIRIAGNALLGTKGDIYASLESRVPALGFKHPMISPEVFHSPAFAFNGTIIRSHEEGKSDWQLEEAVLTFDTGIRSEINGKVHLGENINHGSISLKALVPEQNCGALFKTIPSTLVPRLSDSRFEGKISGNIGVALNFQKLKALRLDLEAKADACHAKELRWVYRGERLNLPTAVFHVQDPKLPEPVRVGPGTKDWVNFNELPAYVWGSAIATEDMGFFEHQGFAPGLIRRGLVMSLVRGRYAYGGSSITQQLLKNILLDRSKHISRKLEEAILTWLVEREVTKERILELYVNCIEYGPNIYGIRQAALTYFGREPKHLRPVEAAFIMAYKPDPEMGHRMWLKQRITPWWQKRIRTIRRRLLEHGWLAPGQALAMTAERVFDRATSRPQPMEKYPEIDQAEILLRDIE